MANSTQVVVKFPTDSRPVTVSFADVLVGGEVITSGALSASNPAGLTVNGLGFTSTTITLNVAAGTDKQSYGVQVTANTDGGHVYVKTLAVVVNADMAVNYQNTNPDAFAALVGKLEAGTAALGKGMFFFPPDVNTTSGIVTWDLLDKDGVVIANGQAFDYQTITVASGKRVEAQAVVNAPSNTRPTLDGQSYQLRWTLNLSGQAYFAFEQLAVTGPNTVPVGVEDIVEMEDNQTFTLSMVSEEPWDTVTVDVYFKNDKVLADQTTTARQTADGWMYTSLVTPSAGTLTAQLEPYTLIWKASNLARPGYVERQAGRLFLINASIMSAITDMKAVVSKAETTILGTQDIIFTDPLLLAYLRRGKDMFNASYGMFTDFTMVNAFGSIREYWLRFSEVSALRAQFLAEGEKVFNYSGASVSLDSDRTQFYQSMADSIQQQLDSEVKVVKQNLIKKGIIGGDGNITSLTAMRKGSNGAVAITITPASNLGYRWGRRF